MPSNTVQNLQCLCACFKLYRICSRYCTESAVFVCILQAAPDTVQNLQCLLHASSCLQILYRTNTAQNLECLHASSCSRYCTESRVFACFKLLQVLYRICVCVLQAVQNLQCLFACFKQPPDTVRNLQCLFACFKLLQILYRIHSGRMLQAASRYCTECAVL